MMNRNFFQISSAFMKKFRTFNLLRMVSPPYRGGAVCVSQSPVELCRLVSFTPGRAIHDEQVEG